MSFPFKRFLETGQITTGLPSTCTQNVCIFPKTTTCIYLDCSWQLTVASLWWRERRDWADLSLGALGSCQTEWAWLCYTMLPMVKRHLFVQTPTVLSFGHWELCCIRMAGKLMHGWRKKKYTCICICRVVSCLDGKIHGKVKREGLSKQIILNRDSFKLF